MNAYISFQAKLTYLFVIRSDFYNNECPETSVKDARESGQMTDPGNAAASSEKCLICMCFKPCSLKHSSNFTLFKHKIT